MAPETGATYKGYADQAQGAQSVAPLPIRLKLCSWIMSKREPYAASMNGKSFAIEMTSFSRLLDRTAHFDPVARW